MRWRTLVEKGEIAEQPIIDFFVQNLPDGRYIVEIDKERTKRSIEQNKFWHGVWLPLIADWMGEIDPENVCRAVKIKLGLCEVITDKLGLKEWKCPSTADMNKPEMTDFLFKVETLMMELTEGQFILPTPDNENNPY